MRIHFMRIATIVVSAIVGISSARAQPAPQKLSGFEQELTSVEMQFIGAMQTKDVASVERMVADDFQGVALNGDSFNRSDMVGDASDGFPKDLRTYEVRVVRLSDNCAVVSYSQIVPGDHPRYRHVSDTWAKEGGAWKLEFQQRTPRLWSAMDLD